MSRILVAFGVALLHVCTALVLTPTKAPFPTSRASTCPRVSNAPLARSRLIVLQETEDGGVEAEPESTSADTVAEAAVEAQPTYVPTDKEVSEVMREMPLVWTESIEERRARAVAKVMAKNDPVEMAKAKKAAAAAAAKAAAAAEAEKKKAAAAEAARIKNEEAAKKKAAAAEVAAAKKAAAAEAKKAKDEAAKAKKAAAAEAKKAKADAAKAKKAAGR